ncbi:MAG: outer membrane protein assembly factor BamD [Alphaproteobacteria bacterium]|nr:outer membrane protein assembly factor BamD [Alphaproteobacteria bacterium]
MTRAALAVTVVALAGLLSGCAADKSQDYVERPVEQLYNEAVDLLAKNDLKGAAKAFDEVERQHPYSSWANKAQVMSAFSHYQAGEYDEAILAAERFIELHPGSPDAPYAYYLKGLSYYEQISQVSRDQKMTVRAQSSLQELMRRYPESEYARDARIKLDLVNDHLAGKEMEVGRYYLKRGNYMAAINRFRAVLDTYQTTSHAPEALHRLAESYTALGLIEEARQVATVLGHNFPNSPWYLDSYQTVQGVRLDTGEPPATGFFGRLWPF